MSVDVGPTPYRDAVRGAQLTREQQGLIFAGLVAFLGVGFIGPAIAGLRDRRRLHRYARARLAKARSAKATPRALSRKTR